MNRKQLRPWWQRKRVFFAALFPLALITAAIVAFVVSDGSKVVVYNETGHALPLLLVQACGQSRTFPPLEDQESVCFNLKAVGGTTPIRLELAKDPPWAWEGQSIKSHGGITVTIRLWPNGQVEAYNSVSWWRQWLN